jgi:polar amino acid transport system substrate-binding protein
MTRKFEMDRRAYLATLGTGAAASLAGCSGLGGGGGQTITPGTAPGFQPFEFRDGGELVGFDIDLTEAVFAETSYELAEWETFEFDSLIQALTNDRIDFIAAAMTINADRDETIDFSDPYYSANQSVIVRADGDFSPSELGDLSGRPIGAQSGTTGEGVIQSELIETGELEESNYNSYDNYVLAVEDLQNGNIDAVVIDEPVGATFADQRPVEVAFIYETGEQYGFGMRTEDDDLTTAVNEGLAAVREDGTYADLTSEWFGS